MDDIESGAAEPVIRTRDLRKIYRLYSKRHHRLLDFLNLLPQNRGLYSEHVALDGVNVEICRGEKVALIGRNGAGKSTFLKAVTGVTEPTSGQLEVRGQTHALLQIGTGFHPDFTGRENVVGYLAHQGLTGRQAENHIEDVIEFAELEEYIDQPLKTYSTGMAARLMFAASTVLQPDLLVLDEVLGVGDAYFAQKSYDRIRELCSGGHTTVLLVSHDTYSASRICERMIWIDRGRVLIDADSPTVIKAYEDSIREQEEQRLRAKKIRSLSRVAQEEKTVPVLIEIRTLQHEQLPAPVHFSRIDLQIDGRSFDGPSIDAEAFDEGKPAHLVREGSAWGSVGDYHGRRSVDFQNFGSICTSVVAAFRVPAELVTAESRFGCHVECRSDEPSLLAVRALAAGRRVELGTLPETQTCWTKHTCRETDAGILPGPDVNVAGRHGTGSISIADVRTKNAAGEETFFLQHGEPVDFEIDYRINDSDLCERAGVMVALHRNGVEDVCRFVSQDLLFDANAARSGTVRACFDSLPIGPGTYTVTVLISREGYYREDTGVYFSINPGVYACLSRVCEIVVQDGGVVAAGTAVVLTAEWQITSGGNQEGSHRHAA